MRIIIGSRENALVWRWQQRLGLDEFDVRLERVSLFAVCDELCRVGNSLVGIRADHDRRQAVIFHTRRLSEEDVVHELLHLRHPDWSERQVNARTAALIQLSRFSGESSMCRWLWWPPSGEREHSPRGGETWRSSSTT